MYSREKSVYSMKWFAEISTIEELRKKYRKLLKQYHPDNESGSVAITQEINEEYDRLFAILSDRNDSDNKSYTYEENERFKTVLNEIVKYDLTIEIIGSWIWCFDGYKYREQLKTLGFTWCKKKKAWVWHEKPYHRYHKKEISLNHIREKYGSQEVRKHSCLHSLSEKK